MYQLLARLENPLVLLLLPWPSDLQLQKSNVAAYRSARGCVCVCKCVEYSLLTQFHACAAVHSCTTTAGTRESAPIYVRTCDRCLSLSLSANFTSASTQASRLKLFVTSKVRARVCVCVCVCVASD